ncbi:cytochrome c oxidase assembly protein [Dietzia sp. CH92]|uniref:cytochrome c oxidase assembly protein n=1 Tax=Dietzia sp. CH92 TaxID=3051823 RepID=UPI0028D364E2|nr:cytochrome c oxidase assembly protein [Dietzia sp. CH92]
MESGHDPAGHGGHTGHEGFETGAAESAAWWVVEAAGPAVLAVALAAYLLGVRRHRVRGPWARWRTAAWIAGLSCVGLAWAGPLAEAARHDFTAHMAGHLLLGMIGPLLVVLAAPVTLALRTLPAGGARTLSTVLRSPPARVVTHPVVAAVLNAGGLWLLYATDLFAHMHASPAVHAAVHAHVLLAGIAFTVAVIGPDPNPHRATLRARATVLVLFIGAHSILGKWLYAHPPAGVDPADARVGAQLMYYGGDVVDLAILVLLFAGWYPGSRFRSRLLPGNPAHGHRDRPVAPPRDPLESDHRIDVRRPAWPGRSASAN